MSAPPAPHGLDGIQKRGAFRFAIDRVRLEALTARYTPARYQQRAVTVRQGRLQVAEITAAIDKGLNAIAIRKRRTLRG